MYFIYNVSSVSVQQSDPIRDSSLCYTVGPHCPSIPNVAVCIHQTKAPYPSHSLSLSTPLPYPGNRKSALLGSDLFLLCK